MGQILHGSATTTAGGPSRAIQHSQEEPEGAPCEGLLWRQPEDGRQVESAVLRFRPADRTQNLPKIDSPCQQRKRPSSSHSEGILLLPLDDCLYALQPTIPHLTRSSLHRCLQRHGDLPVAAEVEKAKPPPSANSRPIRSASFISTSPRFELRKASSTCSSPSTERRSSPSSRCTRRWRVAPRGTSCAA